MLFPVWSRRTFSAIICYLPSGPTHGGYTGWCGSENSRRGLVGEIISPIWLGRVRVRVMGRVRVRIGLGVGLGLGL